MRELPLGARRPDDDEHVEKYPFAAVARGLSPQQIDAALAKGVRSKLPPWHPTHDQGWQPSCVGHATVMERAIVNLAQRRKRNKRPFTVRYDPIHVWRQAKAIDEWPESVPEDENYGTSARAAYNVLRDQGAVPVHSVRFAPDGRVEPVGARALSRTAGVVQVNRWLTSVDMIRAAFAEGYKAIPIATAWYAAFEPWNLEQRNDADGRMRYWMRSDPRSFGGGHYRGFHEMCLFGADDRIDAFWLKNSWGDSWGERSVALLPYEAAAECFSFWAEAVAVTDR